MANFNRSTRFVPAEDVHVFTHTTTSQLFSRLLCGLAVMVEMERDIEHVNVWDTAFCGWLRDAELAGEAVSTHLSALLASPAERPEDHKLHFAAVVLHRLMCCEELGSFTRIYNAIQLHAWPFRCVGIGAVARRVDVMLKTMLARIDDLATLTAYRDDFDVDPQPDASSQDAFPPA